ncbi:MAG: DsbA family oxidoreductase, partial [Rhodospirillaceae bacterium]
MAQQSDLQIDIVSDVVCPWCILGYKQLETALTLEGFSAEIRWHPFELNPHMPVGGQNLRQHLAKKYGTTLENSIKARKRLTEMGAELGFSFAYTDDMRMYNTNLAHQLLYWAKESAADPLATVHALKMALFEAFFTHRKPLDEIETLVAIAETIGL